MSRMPLLSVCYILIVFLGILLKNHRTAYIVTITTMLTLISGLRHIDIGLDTEVYYSLFEQSKSFGMDIPLSRDLETGYLWFQMMFSKIFPSFHFFLLFIAVFFHVAFARVVHRYSPDPLWSYLFYYVLFFSFYGVTGLRQTIAAALCLMAIPFIEKKKLIPFIILVMLATSFHTIAIVFLPAYFLLQIKISRPYLVIASIGIAIMMILQQTILRQVTDFFVNLTGDEHYDSYGNTRFAILNYAIYTFTLTLAAALFFRKTLKKFPKAKYFYNSMLIGCALVITGLQRLTMFYSIGTCFVIPYVMDAFEDKRFLRFAQKIMIIALFFLHYKSITDIWLDRFIFFWQSW